MTKFYEKLMDQKDDAERDRMISEYVQKMERRYPNKMRANKIRRDFLKHSENFKRVCEWFEEAKERHPYPAEFAKHEPSGLGDFFICARTLFSKDNFREQYYPMHILSGFHTFQLDDSDYNIFQEFAVRSPFLSWAFGAKFLGKPELFSKPSFFWKYP